MASLKTAGRNAFGALLGRTYRQWRRSADLHLQTTDEAGRGLERADLRVLLDRALQTLSEAQRQTFVLYADAGLSYREVADVLGISIGTVMSRLYYARQKLRAFLAERTGNP